MRWFRRPRFRPEWRRVLETRMAHWRLLDPAEQDHLEDITAVLVARKRWEAARGFRLTDEMKVLISAQAGLLLLGLDHQHFRAVRTIIVHPSTMTQRTVRPGPVRGTFTDEPQFLIGQAHHDGPVLISWADARRGARHPERGDNVVYHEFAHRLDMLDGMIDGTPVLEGDQLDRWVEVCTREFRRVQHGDPDSPLRDYAATNPGEFFAVATEEFFCRPLRLQEMTPDLYEVLAAFYRQDPAARERAGPGR